MQSNLPESVCLCGAPMHMGVCSVIDCVCSGTISIQNIMRTVRLKDVIAECRLELATNFDVPAISIISYHASRVALTAEQFTKFLEEVPL